MGDEDKPSRGGPRKAQFVMLLITTRSITTAPGFEDKIAADCIIARSVVVAYYFMNALGFTRAKVRSASLCET